MQSRSNLVVASLIFLSHFATFAAHAEDNPFRRRPSRSAIARKIIHFIDNASVGLIQTIIGAGHVTYVAISRGRDAIEIHSPEDSEIFQIRGVDTPYNGAAYSMGLFQIGNFAEDHEGGHTVASATLGPLYLPTVALSYLIQSHSSSFIEDWADLEADAAQDDPFYFTSQVEVGYGILNHANQTHDVLTIRISLDEHQDADSHDQTLYKAYHWLQTKLSIPLSNRFSDRQDTLPVYAEIDLLEKTVILTDEVFSNRRHGFQHRVETTQRYGHIEHNPLLQMLHFKALEWKANYGFSYTFRRALEVTLNAGVQSSIDILRPYVFYDNADPYFSRRTPYVSAGFQSELRITLFEYFSILAGIERTWGTQSLDYRRTYAALTNELRAPKRRRRLPFVQAMELTVEASREELNFRDSPASSRRVHRGDFTFGIRF